MMNQPGQLVKVSISQLESKFRSKKELYTFLIQDCQAYLPPLNSTNIYFFKQIIRGEKDYVRRDKIMVAAVPQIEGLTVEDILSLFAASPRLLKHIPDERDWVHLDRKWLSDILYTLDKANFQAVIDRALKKRKDKLEESRNLTIDMRPEFVQALTSCMSFSSGTGRASILLKGSSKRKRTRAELQEVKQDEELLKQDKQTFLQRVKRLRQERAALLQAAAQQQNFGVGAAAGDDDDDAQPQPARFNI